METNFNQFTGKQAVKAIRLYKLTWYLVIEEQLKQLLITDKQEAENRYNELKGILPNGCWLSLQELVEDEEHIIREGEELHYNEI